MLSSNEQSVSYGEIVNDQLAGVAPTMVVEIVKTVGERVHQSAACGASEPAESPQKCEFQAGPSLELMDKLLEKSTTENSPKPTGRRPQDRRVDLLGIGQAARPLLTKAGRPTVVTPEIAEQLCLLMAVGFSRRQAAAYLGISPTAITNAATRDPELAMELARAEQLADLQPELTLMAKSRKNWRAAAWYLEHKRKHPRPLSREEKEEKHQERIEARRRKMEVNQAGYAAADEARKKQREAEEAQEAAKKQAREAEEAAKRKSRRR